MTLLFGALSIGLILSLLSLGVLVAYRLFGIPDITADGTITLGASVTAVCCMRGIDPFLATALGTAAGGGAGALTGILHTRFRINALLSGILMMTALYSVNLRVMGSSNLPLMQYKTLASIGEERWRRLFGEEGVSLLGWKVSAGEVGLLIGVAAIVTLVCLALYRFFRSHLGIAMIATGNNPQMVRALGGNVERNIVLGLALSNGLIALGGSLLAQYQGFADVQMGIGMIIWGLASVIIGEALTGSSSLGMRLMGAVIGSVVFRLLVAIALRWGLNPNDLKLITAVFVFVALTLPAYCRRVRRRRQPPSLPRHTAEPVGS